MVLITTSSSHGGYVMKILLLLCMVFLSVFGQSAWQRPGCHRLGFTQTVEIPGCVKFQVVTNACRGFCQSYAFPSTQNTLETNTNHIITSRAECCAITETHDVKVTVKCITGYRDLTFKSAASCACSVCKKG